MSEISTRKKISIVLNTYNAETYLAQVLEALQQFDEIVVCDMHSTDSTQAIAKEYGARIILHDRCDICEPARNAAIQAATYDWVFILDADEIIPPALRNYLYQHTTSPNSEEALRIPRKNFFMGHFMHCLYPDYVIRFARKDCIEWPAAIHSQPIIKGKIKTIPESESKLALVHLATNTISDRLQKTDTYTSKEVLRRKPKKYHIGTYLIKPLGRFIHIYFQKGGFRDGKAGFIYAVLNAIYKFITLAKQEEGRKKH